MNGDKPKSSTPYSFSEIVAEHNNNNTAKSAEEQSATGSPSQLFSPKSTGSSRSKPSAKPPWAPSSSSPKRATRLSTMSTPSNTTLVNNRRRSSLAASPSPIAAGGSLSSIIAKVDNNNNNASKLLTRHPSLAAGGGGAAAVSDEDDADEAYCTPGNLLVIAEDEADEQQAVDDFNKRILMRQRLTALSTSPTRSLTARPVSPVSPSSTAAINHVIAKAKRRFSLMKDSSANNNNLLIPENCSGSSSSLLVVPETDITETLLSEQCPPSIQYAAAHARRRFSLPAQQSRAAQVPLLPPTRRAQQQQHSREQPSGGGLPIFKGKNDIFDFSAFAKFAQKSSSRNPSSTTRLKPNELSSSSNNRGRRTSIANFAPTEHEKNFKRASSPVPLPTAIWQQKPSAARSGGGRKLSLLGEQPLLLLSNAEAAEAASNFSNFPLSHKLSSFGSELLPKLDIVDSKSRSSRLLASSNVPQNQQFDTALLPAASNYGRASARRLSLAQQHRQHAFELSHTRYSSMQQRELCDSPPVVVGGVGRQRTKTKTDPERVAAFALAAAQQHYQLSSPAKSESSSTSSADDARAELETGGTNKYENTAESAGISISSNGEKVNTMQHPKLPVHLQTSGTAAVNVDTRLSLHEAAVVAKVGASSRRSSLRHVLDDTNSLLVDNFSNSPSHHRNSGETSPTFNSATVTTTAWLTTTTTTNKDKFDEAHDEVKRVNVNAANNNIDDNVFIQPSTTKTTTGDWTTSSLLSTTTLAATAAAAAVLNNNSVVNTVGHIDTSAAVVESITDGGSMTARAAADMTFETTAATRAAASDDNAKQQEQYRSADVTVPHPERQLNFLPSSLQCDLSSSSLTQADETLSFLRNFSPSFNSTIPLSGAQRLDTQQHEEKETLRSLLTNSFNLLEELSDQPAAAAAKTPDSNSNVLLGFTYTAESRLTTPTTMSHIASTTSSINSSSTSTSTSCSSPPPSSAARLSNDNTAAHPLSLLIDTNEQQDKQQRPAAESGTLTSYARQQYSGKHNHEHRRRRRTHIDTATTTTTLLTDGERRATNTHKSQHQDQLHSLGSGGTTNKEADRDLKNLSSENKKATKQQQQQQQQLEKNSPSVSPSSVPTAAANTTDVTTTKCLVNTEPTADVHETRHDERTVSKQRDEHRHQHHHHRRRRRQKRRVESERSNRTFARHVIIQQRTVINPLHGANGSSAPQLAHLMSDSLSGSQHYQHLSSSSESENEQPVHVNSKTAEKLNTTQTTSAPAPVIIHRNTKTSSSFESGTTTTKRTVQSSTTTTIILQQLQQKRGKSFGDDPTTTTTVVSATGRVRPRFRKRHTDPLHFIRSITEERALREQQQHQQQQTSLESVEEYHQTTLSFKSVMPTAASSAPNSPRQRSKSSSEALVSSASATNELYSIEEHQQDGTHSRRGSTVCHNAALAILHRNRRKSFTPTPGVVALYSKMRDADNSGRGSPANGVNNSASSATSVGSDTPPWGAGSAHGFDHRHYWPGDAARSGSSPPPASSQAVLRRKRHSIIATGRTRPAKTTTTTTSTQQSQQQQKQQQAERIVREANKKAAQSRSGAPSSSSYYTDPAQQRTAAFSLTHAFTDPGASTSSNAVSTSANPAQQTTAEETNDDAVHEQRQQQCDNLEFDFSADIAAAIANAAARTAAAAAGSSDLLNSSATSSRRNSATAKRHSIISDETEDAAGLSTTTIGNNHAAPPQSPNTLRNSAATSRRRQSLVRYSEVVDEEVIETAKNEVDGKYHSSEKNSGGITSAIGGTTAPTNGSSDEREDQLRAISPTIELIARAKSRGKRLSLPFLRSDAVASPFDAFQHNYNKHAFAERSTGVVGRVKPDLAITRQAPFFVWRLNDSERFHHEIVDENAQAQDNSGTAGGSGDRASGGGAGQHHLSLILKQSSSTSASATGNDFYDSSSSRRGSNSDKSDDRRSSVQSADGGRRVHHHHRHHHHQRASLSDVSSGSSSRRRSSAGLSAASLVNSDVEGCSSLSSSRRSSLINWWHRRKSWTLQPFTSGSGGVSLSVSRRSSASFGSRRTSSLSSFSSSFLFGFRSAGGTSSEENNMEEGYPESGDAKCTCTYCSRQRRFSDQSYLHKPSAAEAIHLQNRTQTVLEASGGHSAESSNQSRESPATNANVNTSGNNRPLAGGKERSFSLRMRTTHRNAGCSMSTTNLNGIAAVAAATTTGPDDDCEQQPTKQLSAAFLQPGKVSSGRHKSWDASFDSNFFQSPELRFYEAVCGKLQQIGLMAADAAVGVVPSALALSRRAPSITSLISAGAATDGRHHIHSSHSFNAALGSTAQTGNNIAHLGKKSMGNQLSMLDGQANGKMLLPITQRRKFSCYSPINMNGGSRLDHPDKQQQHDSLIQQRRRSHTYNFHYTEYKSTKAATKTHSSPPVVSAEPAKAAAVASEAPAKHEDTNVTASSYLFPSQVENVRLLDRFHRWTLTNFLNTVLHSSKKSTKSIASQELFGTEVSVKDKTANQTGDNNSLAAYAGAAGKRGSWFVDSFMNWFDNNHQHTDNQVVLKQRNLLTEGLTLEQIFTTGTLFLTETNLIFVSIPSQAYERWILYSLIDSVEQLPETTFGFPIRVRCKHFLTTTFLVSDKADAAILDMAIRKLSKPSNIRRVLASASSVHLPSKSNKIANLSDSGPFNMGSEYERLGLPNADWKVAALNWDYLLCNTYPKLLVIPSMAEQTILRGSALFRKHNQLPVLTFFNERTGGCLVRCSEPVHHGALSPNGIKTERSPEDETLLNCIKNCSAASVHTNRLYLFDVQCAVKQPAPGPGFKAMLSKQWLSGKNNTSLKQNKASFYIKEDFSLTTMNAETLDTTRTNLECLNDACDLNLKPRPENATLPPVLAYIEAIRESGWLQSAHSLLKAACAVATRVNDGYSVILQASDVDRIAQIGSLAQLLLDPYYRTTEGFLALLAKDWLAFGYPFEHRCGRREDDSASPSSHQPPGSQQRRLSKTSASSRSQQALTPNANSGNRKEHIRQDSTGDKHGRSISTANTPEILRNGSVTQRKKYRKHKSSSQRSQTLLSSSSIQKSTDNPSDVNCTTSLVITESPNIRTSISASASPVTSRYHINRTASSREYVTDESDEFIAKAGSAHSGIELHIASSPDAEKSPTSPQVSPKTVRCTSFGSRRSRSRRSRQSSSRSSKKTSPSQQRNGSSQEREAKDRAAASVAAKAAADSYNITTPTLTQFFDCVYQLMQQLPFEFRFNERFLIDLHEAVYSGQYSEFWGNCERERLSGDLMNGTDVSGKANESEAKNDMSPLSIAGRERATKSYVNTVLRKRQHNYVNPLTTYLALTTSDPILLEPNQHMLQVDLSPQCSLEMFNSLYFRFESGVHERESIDECVALLTEQCDSLQRHVSLLENQLKIINDYEATSNVAADSRRSSHNTTSSMLARTLTSAAAAMNFNAAPQNNFSSSTSMPSPDTTAAATFRGMASRWWAGDTSNSPSGTTAQQVNAYLRNRISDGVAGGSNVRPKTIRQQSSVTARPTAPLPYNVLQLLVSPLAFDYVALTFQSIRAIVDGKCDCLTSFNNINRKYCCMSCGRIICKRCVQQTVLPGHARPTSATLHSSVSNHHHDYNVENSVVSSSAAVNACGACSRTVAQLKVLHKNAAMTAANFIGRGGAQQPFANSTKQPPRVLPSKFNGNSSTETIANSSSNIVKAVRPGSFALASKLSVLNELLYANNNTASQNINNISGDSSDNLSVHQRNNNNNQRKWSTGSNVSAYEGGGGAAVDNGRRSPSTLNRQATTAAIVPNAAAQRFSARSPSIDSRGSFGGGGGGGGGVFGNVVRRFQTSDLIQQPQRRYNSFNNSISTRGGSLIPYGAASPGGGRSPSPHSPSGTALPPSSSSSYRQGLLSLSTYYGDVSPYGSRKASTVSTMTQDEAMRVATAAATMSTQGGHRPHSAVSSTYSNTSVNSGEQFMASSASSRHGGSHHGIAGANSNRANGYADSSSAANNNQRGRIVMDNIFYGGR